MLPSACPDEDAILAFLGHAGVEASSDRERLASHFAGCEGCARLLADLARATASEERAGMSAEINGRYVLLSTLGAGAMGVVQAAFDRQLDRKVALKFLSAADGEDTVRARTRLQREAQALARLAHPNVVTVHEVGVLEGEVYVAMELVQGANLREWLSAHPRATDEVLGVLRQAGEGLAAAHAAGLVHRDFKPDNVLVGDDGRVRVTDFGLARSAGDADEGAAGSDAEDHRITTLTRTGVRAGTPAYMAPEQKASGVPSPRSDVYSFCVTLHEAITGARPGAEGSRRAPAWLDRAIARGLRERPEERWPSMRALLDVLARGPRVTPVRVGTIAFAIVAAVGTGMMIRARAAVPSPCAPPDHAFDGIWDGAARASVERALRASGREASIPYVVRALDEYAASWLRAEVDTCTATRVRGEQSEHLLDLRMACLDDRRRSVTRAVSVLAMADADVASRSAEIASSLPGVEACTRTRSLEEIAAPPAGAAAAVGDAKLALDEGRTLFYAGKNEEARARVAPAIAAMTRVGYAPLLGQLLFWRASMEQELSLGHECEATLSAAAVQSIEAHDDATLARIWTRLGDENRDRRDAARAWVDQAGAAIRRLGGDDELEGERLLTLGRIIEERSDAQATLLRARELLVKTRGEDYYLVATTDQALGNVAFNAVHLDDASRYHARALALRLRLFGVDHRATVSSIFNVAEDALARHRPDEARAALRELGRRIAKHNVMERAWYERKLHDIARQQNDVPGALEHSRAAASLYTTSTERVDWHVGYALGDVGEDLLDLHRFREAIAPLEEASRRLAPSGETASVDIEYLLGRAYYEAGDRARGRTLLGKVREVYAKNPDATTLDMLGQVDAWRKAHP